MVETTKHDSLRTTASGPRLRAIFSLGLAHQQVADLAPKRPAELFEHRSAKHAGAIVVERQRGRIADVGFLRKPVEGPPALFHNLLERAVDHRGSLAERHGLWQAYFISKESFTCCLFRGIIFGGRGATEAPCLWNAGPKPRRPARTPQDASWGAAGRYPPGAMRRPCRAAAWRARSAFYGTEERGGIGAAGRYPLGR